MPGAHFVFETSGFADDPATLEESVNGIAGHALASWLASGLSAAGFDASPVWAEDHGWDFGVTHNGARYLCSCSIDGDDLASREAQVSIDRVRSMADRLMGRNGYQPADPVGVAIAKALVSSPHVTGLSTEVVR